MHLICHFLVKFLSYFYSYIVLWYKSSLWVEENMRELRVLKEEDKEGSRFHESKDENDSLHTRDALKRKRKRK